MKVLVIGSGGREHTIVYFLNKSSLVDRLFWTPGNAGGVDIAENPGIPVNDFPALLQFAKKEKINLTVVGPEAPLVNGLSDIFTENDLVIFGPGSEGAKIEGSKIYAKQLMKKKGIPTAGFADFYDMHSAAQYIKKLSPPYVIKADGLAAGKGVLIATDEKEAHSALNDMFEKKKFGVSGTKIVIEEFLSGEEATVLALCDGKNIIPLLSSQDHKPVFDGDRGPNTGGMGAIAPAPVVSDAVMDRVMERILYPLVDELNALNISYKGVVYVGLMIRDGNPYVVEFNCRFGDPEAEAVFPLLDSDLCEFILHTVQEKLKNYRVEWKDGYSCDVVLASGGYPGQYEKGKEIEGLERIRPEDGHYVFHAGTKRVGERVVTNGGRVLNVVGTGKSLKEAIDSAYRAVGVVHFDSMHYRKDIGSRGLRYFQ